MGRALFIVVLGVTLSSSGAQADWVNGQTLYLNGPPGLGLACQTCHDNPPALYNISRAANNPTLIASKIETNPPMSPFQGRLTSADLVDIAAYIASPNVNPQPLTVPAAAAPYMGLWWNPDESGWGMSITQHGNTIFAVPYTYDSAGQPTWYAMSNCPMLTAGSCTGDLYKVSGGSSPVVAWNGLGKVVSSAGSGTLSFDDVNHGRFTYILNGVSGSKSIERQLFSNGTPQFSVDYTDLWWNPNESGWGIALTQDHGMIFAAWYAYKDKGEAIWYVASSCPLSGNLTSGHGCTGDLYQVVGGSPLTANWNGANKAVTAVGSVTFTFSDADNGTMAYLLNGVAGTRIITRQGF